MRSRAKKLKLDGTAHVGEIQAGGVAVYRSDVTSAGRYRFGSSAKVILILELRDVDGNVLDRKRGRRNELVSILKKKRYFISLSGATARTAGDYVLTGEPA